MNINCECMKMTRSVYEQIEATIGAQKPECGGVLGARENGMIEAYWFDCLGTSSNCSYAPDAESINQMLEEEWFPEGIFMTGMIHSHANGIAIPSCGDIGYGAQILDALDTVDAFYLPVAAFCEGRFVIEAFVIRRDEEQRVMCRKIPCEVIG